MPIYAPVGAISVGVDSGSTGVNVIPALHVPYPSVAFHGWIDQVAAPALSVGVTLTLQLPPAVQSASAVVYHVCTRVVPPLSMTRR
jgi:hypothetical protein